jgi:hypothetical protein
MTMTQNSSSTMKMDPDTVRGEGGCGTGRGGGCSGGCGGRGNQGGRGGGGRDGAGGPPQGSLEQVHNQTDGDGHDDDDALFLVDNLDQVKDYSSLVYSHYLHSGFVGYTSTSVDSSILLDSCSTVNLIANKALLHGIHRVDTTMRIDAMRGSPPPTNRDGLGTFQSQCGTTRMGWPTSCHSSWSRSTIGCNTTATNRTRSTSPNQMGLL